jgi:hypothetical protein
VEKIFSTVLIKKLKKRALFSSKRRKSVLVSFGLITLKREDFLYQQALTTG